MSDSEPILVIKIGGNVLDHRQDTISFLETLKSIRGRKILIHGGGKMATEMSAKLGIDTKMIEGRRITDFETLKVATMVYAGWINKSLVADMQSMDINAIGISGADLNLIQAHKRVSSDIDYGWVGDIDKVFIKRWSFLLENGVLPVLCAISHDGKGHLLNTNADTMATEVAIALSNKYPIKLIYCFEKKGVMLDQNDESTLIRNLERNYYESLRAEGIISKGMIPKLENAFRAASSRIQDVYICAANELAHYSSSGTKIVCPLPATN